MTNDERRDMYMRMYQTIGASWHELPDVADVWPDDGAPPVEWHLYNALDNALHAAMDTLAALVDVTEDDAA